VTSSSGAGPGVAGRYSGLAYPALRGANQLFNAAGVLAALEALRDRLPVTAQAVRNGLAMVELPGRFQIVPGQPTLVLDVAHNPHSVAALAANLDAMGYLPGHACRVWRHGRQGSGPDAGQGGAAGRPLVFHRSAHGTRGNVAMSLLAKMVAGAGNTRKDGRPARWSHPTPAPYRPCSAAVAAADPADRIVVFGSFFTVGGVLKDGIPRLQATHLAD
jgi:dihydrofolate synthase/folylpolyglutamate synthase